jgi:1,4-dihydroxy-2-naphthoate octaprenyltransferase
VAVFIFFGLVATVGTAYVQAHRATGLEVLAALPVGLMAVALLVVNNLRDIPGDTAAGKRTLAVRLGDRSTRRLYCACLVGAFALLAPVAVSRPWALLALAAAPLALAPVRAVAQGARGRDLIAVLGATGRAQLAIGALLALGITL